MQYQRGGAIGHHVKDWGGYKIFAGLPALPFLILVLITAKFSSPPEHNSETYDCMKNWLFKEMMDDHFFSGLQIKNILDV